MKKKLTLIVSAVALGALLAVGGTLAWFTDTETATNVVTTGNVKIAIHENGKLIDADYSGITFPANSTPGTTLEKNVIVKNTGDNDAYVRAQVIVEGADLTAEQIADITEAIKMTDNGWEKGLDGKYYHTTKIAKGNDTAKLMDTIAIPAEWGNAFTNKTFNVRIVAEAIQADNLLADDVEANAVNLAAAFGAEGVADAN